MERQQLLDALSALPDEAFAHVAAVCHDIARRLPDDPAFGPVGVGARACLGIPEPKPAPQAVPDATPTANDVTVGLTGVEGNGEAGGLG
jgi:hypothetical protein